MDITDHETLHGLIRVLELLGVAVFAVSGALVAAAKRMDPFGFVVIGAVTAIGGGTVRDLVLDLGPVFWVVRPEYLLVSVGAALPLFFVAHLIVSRQAALLWFDALGMAFFTVTGTQKALLAGAPASVAIAMGVITAAFGGILRDVLCGEKPLLLQREIYATAALAGASMFVTLTWAGAPDWLAAVGAFGLTFLVRALAIVRGWSFPAYGR